MAYLLTTTTMATTVTSRTIPAGMTGTVGKHCAAPVVTSVVAPVAAPPAIPISENPLLNRSVCMWLEKPELLRSVAPAPAAGAGTLMATTAPPRTLEEMKAHPPTLVFPNREAMPTDDRCAVCRGVFRMLTYAYATPSKACLPESGAVPVCSTCLWKVQSMFEFFREEARAKIAHLEGKTNIRVMRTSGAIEDGWSLCKDADGKVLIAINGKPPGQTHYAIGPFVCKPCLNERGEPDFMHRAMTLESFLALNN